MQEYVYLPESEVTIREINLQVCLFEMNRIFLWINEIYLVRWYWTCCVKVDDFLLDTVSQDTQDVKVCKQSAIWPVASLDF